MSKEEMTYWQETIDLRNTYSAAIQAYISAIRDFEVEDYEYKLNIWVTEVLYDFMRDAINDLELIKQKK